MRRVKLVVALALVAAGFLSGATAQDSGTPEERAVRFLSGEVPRWPVENNCFSCHNNGDAARALYSALRAGHAVEDAALDATTDWLRRPDAWDDNALGLAFSDQTLARIQFAGALVAAMDAGRVEEAAPLAAAAARIALDQKEDGSWRLDSSGSLGSPVTYGTALATWAALRSLERVDDPSLAPVITRGEAWLRSVEVKTVLDAAAVTLGLGVATDEPAIRQRQACLDLIVRGQAPSGGWGAYLTTPVEPFDTALVLLALSPLAGAPELTRPAVDVAQMTELRAEGRAFLIAEQLDDGSWVETTRPAGQQSYAQYISTTGWATLALLATGSGN